MNSRKIGIGVCLLLFLIGLVTYFDFNFWPISQTFYDTNEKKLSVVYYRTKDLSSVYRIKKYYPNGEVKEVSELKNGQYEGWRLFYNSRGDLTSRCRYSNDKMNGFSYWYDRDGKEIQKAYRLNDKEYGSVYSTSRGNSQVYNAIDFSGAVFYVAQYDFNGNLKKQEGLVFSPVIVRSNADQSVEEIWNDSVAVNKDVQLLITVAEPMHTKTKVMIQEEFGSMVSVVELPISNCSAILCKKFSSLGKQKFTLRGELVDNRTKNVIRRDSITKVFTVY